MFNGVRNVIALSALFCALIPTISVADEADIGKEEAMEKEKNKFAEDPTKVVTQFGASYGGDQARLSASLGIGPVNKINLSTDVDGEEWRIGGSWLFDVGIVNVNFGKKEFDNGANQTNYSIGTFMPLSYFGFEPWGWQVFAMGGYTYNDGEVPCQMANAQSCGPDFNEADIGNMVLSPSTSSSGYLGYFGLKPVTDKFRILTFGVGSLGSNDYSGYAFGLGGGYSLTKRQSISLFGFFQDNSYGSDEQLSLSYKYQFN